MAAKVKPDLVVAFRGPALKLIQKPGPDASEEQEQIGELVADLKKGGAVKVVARLFDSLGSQRWRACRVAASQPVAADGVAWCGENQVIHSGNVNVTILNTDRPMERCKFYLSIYPFRSVGSSG